MKKENELYVDDDRMNAKAIEFIEINMLREFKLAIQRREDERSFKALYELTEYFEIGGLVRPKFIDYLKTCKQNGQEKRASKIGVARS